MAEIKLVVQRRIEASREKVFEAWTQPEHLRRWWGPGDTTCPEASIDLRVGGMIRIANLTPSGRTIWIEGRFQAVEPPARLVYTWKMSVHEGEPSHVTVRFEPDGTGTRVTVVHTRLDSQATADSHEAGWHGCLDGLEHYLAHG